MVSPFLVPDYAYLDPALTVSMPRSVTASTGIDALTHCIEAFANKFAHPLVDMFALEGIRLIVANIERACADGGDIEARAAMLRASYFGGLCLGPVNTAAVHALAYPLGGEFHVPHGVANSILLPHVLRFNLVAAPARYAQVAEAVGIGRTGDDLADARAGVERIADISRRIGIAPGMSAYGIQRHSAHGGRRDDRAAPAHAQSARSDRRGRRAHLRSRALGRDAAITLRNTTMTELDDAVLKLNLELSTQLSNYWHEIDFNGGRDASSYYTEDAEFHGQYAAYLGVAKIQQFYDWRVAQGRAPLGAQLHQFPRPVHRARHGRGDQFPDALRQERREDPAQPPADHDQPRHRPLQASRRQVAVHLASSSSISSRATRRSPTPISTRSERGRRRVRTPEPHKTHGTSPSSFPSRRSGNTGQRPWPRATWVCASLPEMPT